jgi:hypothetical protein
VFGLDLLLEAPELLVFIGVKDLRVNNPEEDVPEVGRQAVGLGAGLPAVKS